MSENNQNWEIRWSNSRSRAYFFNSESKESRWDAPPSLSPPQIQALPGAKYLSQQPSTSGASGEKAAAAAASGAHEGQVRASHLLVKHSGSRRPASWRSTNITRSKEEAIEVLKGYQKQLKEGGGDMNKVFADLARTESDCSSARDGGNLGWFGRNQMQKPFEEATYALEVGQLSDIIDTDSGVHLIYRTG